jgi:hypothetical protein
MLIRFTSLLRYHLVFQTSDISGDMNTTQRFAVRVKSFFGNSRCVNEMWFSVILQFSAGNGIFHNKTYTKDKRTINIFYT